MELRQYATIVWKWLWLIVLAAAVAAFSSWLAVKDQPASYQTSTTLMIGQAIEKANPTYAEFNMSERLAQSYSELLRREPILRATAQSLGFEDQWPLLRDKISVNLVPGTQLLEIKVIDTNPQRAQFIANGVAHQLIASIEESRPQDSNRQFIEEQAASFPPKIDAAQKEIQKLEGELGETFSAWQIQDIQNRIDSLEQQVNGWQATFAQYQLLLGEGGVNVLTVFEKAALPTHPIGSAWYLQVALAAAIGGALAVGAAFVIEYLDDTLKSAEDLKEATGLATLGAISRIGGDSPSDRLITVHEPKSPVSEAYRVMRTNLQFSAMERPLKSLVVTSPSPLEGKSTTLSNLGVVIAQAGKSTVLVDADLRRPMLHQIFQLPNKQGLTNLLLQDEPSPDGCLQETGIENLRVITSGPLPPNPSELLGSPRMKHLLELLEEAADIVILDTSPTLLVTDAAILSTQTDAVLIVTDAKKTRRAAAQEAVENLQQVGANILGGVMNRLPNQRSSGSYYYYAHDNGGKRHRGAWYQRIPLIGRWLTR